MFETYLAVLAAVVLAPIVIGIFCYLTIFVFLFIVTLFGR